MISFYVYLIFYRKETIRANNGTEFIVYKVQLELYTFRKIDYLYIYKLNQTSESLFQQNKIRFYDVRTHNSFNKNVSTFDYTQFDGPVFFGVQPQISNNPQFLQDFIDTLLHNNLRSHFFSNQNVINLERVYLMIFKNKNDDKSFTDVMFLFLIFLILNFKIFIFFF